MSSNRLENRVLTGQLAGRRVVVGFSGGADSVSLLYRLVELQKELQITVEAAHLNHCLRGEESQRDEDFVRSFCHRLSVPLTVRQIDIAALASQRGLSLEACGREERYRLFEDVAGEDGMIATAHTLSDNMETVIFHMIRGTALKGLCGIPAIRGNIVRPLLHCTREDVEDYCQRKGLCYVTDSSNFSTDYVRNKIRSEIVPRFFEINPSAAESFSRMESALRKDEDYLEGIASGIWDKMQEGNCLSLVPLEGREDIFLDRIAVKVLERYGFPLEYHNVKRVSALLKKGESRQEMTKGVYLRAQGQKLFLEKSMPVVPFFQKEAERPKEGETHTVIVEYNEISEDIASHRRRNLQIKVVGGQDAADFKKIYKNLLIFAVDYDTIIGKLVFRQKVAGDRLKISKSNGTKTVKKLFNEKRTPLLDRQKALVFCDDAGILGVEFLGVGERAAVTKDTRRVLMIAKTR